MKKLKELILELGELAHCSHFWVDGDNWYSCPKAPDGCANDAAGTECNCGADEHNAKVDKIINTALIVNKWGRLLESTNNTKAMLIEPQEQMVKKIDWN
jgi:hypothetical protein